MKVILLRNARITHKAGETVEVSPSEYLHLVTTGSAKPAAAQEKPTKKKR